MITTAERIQNAPLCKNTPCPNKTNWSHSKCEYGMFCSRECHNEWRKGKPVKFKSTRAKQMFVRPQDPPICEAVGCTNPVKWNSTSWATYCGKACMLKSKKFVIQSTKRANSALDEDEYDSWNDEEQKVVDQVIGRFT